MRAVMDTEIALGNHPRDVSNQNLGYDIESRDGQTGRLRFLEVKGRRAGAETVTVSHNEIMCGLNKTEQFALVIVEVEGADAAQTVYIWHPFTREPDQAAAGVIYSIQELLKA